MSANDNNTNNSNNINQVFNRMDNFHYTLFQTYTLIYARYVPKCLRRVFEFIFLLKALISLYILINMHIHFSNIPNTCIDHVKDVWPRDGILRLEIIPSYDRSYAEQTGMINELLTVEKSYEREYKLKGIDTSDETVSFIHRSTKTKNSHYHGKVEPSPKVLFENKFQEISTPKYNVFTNDINIQDEKKNMFSSTSKTINTICESNVSLKEDSGQLHSTQCQNSFNTPSPPIDFNNETFYKNCIYEISLEHTYMHLSPNDRMRFGIPVMLVTLDPTRDKCLYNSCDQYSLEYYYECLLLNYLNFIRLLCENEKKQVFVRNVITDKQYISVSMTNMIWYISSFLTMLIFTVMISMIWRSSIKVMVLIIMPDNFRPLISFRGAQCIPPLLAFLLNVYAVVSIISINFNYHALTVIKLFVIVCVSDQYYTTCCHLPITKKHWLKFFYLYQFFFYSYYYRFNGHLYYFALDCSWHFIQHSMIYFYHHYELPYLVEYARRQQR